MDCETGAWSTGILQSGGQARGWDREIRWWPPTYMGREGIEATAMVVKRPRRKFGQREPGKPQHSWGGQERDKESRGCEV